MNDEYALFCPRRNRFFIVGDNHKVLKFIQLLVMSYELLYLVKINGLPNYRKGLIVNRRCLNLSIAGGEKIGIELDMYVTDPSNRIDVAETAPQDSDVQMQLKLMFMYDLLIYLEQQQNNINKKNLDQIEILKNGLTALKEFMSITMPNDESMSALIDSELRSKMRSKKYLTSFSSDMFSILQKIDYSLDLNEFKKQIVQEIQQVPEKCYYFNPIKKKISEYINQSLQ